MEIGMPVTRKFSAGVSASSMYENIRDYARHAVYLIQKEGDTVLDAIDTAFSAYSALTGRDWPALFAALDKERRDVNEIIAAITQEFNL